MAIIYLSQENFTCPKQMISFTFTVLAETICKLFRKQYETRYKLYCINSVDPDQLASEEAS